MNNKTLSDGEWKLMNLLWDESPLTIGDMVSALRDDTGWTKATINIMLNRLESMYMSDAQLPVYSVKSQIANAIDLFIHLRRDHRGVRQVMEIAELVGFDGSNYQLNYLFTISDKKGKLEKTGNRLVNDQRLKRMWREEGRPVD